jgi:hypothetical protein
LPAPYTTNGVRVTVEGLYTSGTTVLGVAGLAENTNTRNYSSCFLTFDIVDSEGVKVGGATAATNGLVAGQKWRFQALFDVAFRTSFQAVRPGRVQCF